MRQVIGKTFRTPFGYCGKKQKKPGIIKFSRRAPDGNYPIVYFHAAIVIQRDNNVKR